MKKTVSPLFVAFIYGVLTLAFYLNHTRTPAPMQVDGYITLDWASQMCVIGILGFASLFSFIAWIVEIK